MKELTAGSDEKTAQEENLITTLISAGKLPTIKYLKYFLELYSKSCMLVFRFRNKISLLLFAVGF